jgi:hypothetical protein
MSRMSSEGRSLALSYSGRRLGRSRVAGAYRGLSDHCAAGWSQGVRELNFGKVVVAGGGISCFCLDVGLLIPRESGCGPKPLRLNFTRNDSVKISTRYSIIHPSAWSRAGSDKGDSAGADVRRIAASVRASIRGRAWSPPSTLLFAHQSDVSADEQRRTCAGRVQESTRWSGVPALCSRCGGPLGVAQREYAVLKALRRYRARLERAQLERGCWVLSGSLQRGRVVMMMSLRAPQGRPRSDSQLPQRGLSL